MSEERLKEIKHSLDFQEIMLINEKETCDVDLEGVEELLKEEKDLYNEVIRLQQENKQLARDKNIMQNYLQLIIDIGYDYDGYNDADNLKLVIDELCKYALYGKKLDDKSIISSSCEQYYNILGEILGDKENES